MDKAPKAELLLVRPEAAPTMVDLTPDIASTYTRMKKWGIPNYRGARVPLRSHLKIPRWRETVHIHGDAQLPDLLEFGFPSGHVSRSVPAFELKNHSSAVRNPTQVKAYLDKETSLGAMAGPFVSKPFVPWFRSNPLFTRPKRDSASLRVILDLSFPQGESVNSGIPREALDGSPFKLKLTSPLDLAALIVKKGPGCCLYKIDLSRAYRQLRGDPLDWPMMGVVWDDESFVDLEIPFGLRHGASACQRVSEAAEEHGADTVAYIDDTGGAALPDTAQEEYERFTLGL